MQKANLTLGGCFGFFLLCALSMDNRTYLLISIIIALAWVFSYAIIRMADAGDMLCRELLKEYCQYLAHALSNAITLLNIREIYIGTPDEAVNRTLEHTLSEILTLRLNTVVQHEVQVRHAHFGVDATLYGTIAAVMERVFEGDIFPGEDCSGDA